MSWYTSDMEGLYFSVVEDNVWFSNEGEIEIGDMETKHIHNIINMITDGRLDFGSDEANEEIIGVFVDELAARGL